MMPERIVTGNRQAAIDNLKRITLYPDMGDVKSKMQELIEFGFPVYDLIVWTKNPNPGLSRTAIDECFNITTRVMQRLQPEGCTKLGLYIHSLKTILQSKFKTGTILDFGCNAWVDASMSLALDSNLMVQLMDRKPLPLYYSAHQLIRRGVRSYVTVVDKPGLPQLTDIRDDVVMIIESTAFEHVKEIRYMFGPLMKKLPRGGLFLTNYTRLDWSRKDLDGYKESHDFAKEAREIAGKLAYRYEWDPAQDKGDGWDLWEIK